MDKEEAVTIMVVDQHEEVCASLAASLERLPGVKVLSHTTNLALAAELAHQSLPDLIVADFVRGGETTRPEILRWLAGMSPDSQLVMYSAYYTEGEREAFESAGAARCLLKGMSIKKLGAELRKVQKAAGGISLNGVTKPSGREEMVR